MVGYDQCNRQGVDQLPWWIFSCCTCLDVVDKMSDNNLNVAATPIITFSGRVESIEMGFGRLTCHYTLDLSIWIYLRFLLRCLYT